MRRGRRRNEQALHPEVPQAPLQSNREVERKAVSQVTSPSVVSTQHFPPLSCCSGAVGQSSVRRPHTLNYNPVLLLCRCKVAHLPVSEQQQSLCVQCCLREVAGLGAISRNMHVFFCLFFFNRGAQSSSLYIKFRSEKAVCKSKFWQQHQIMYTHISFDNTIRI